MSERDDIWSEATTMNRRADSHREELGSDELVGDDEATQTQVHGRGTMQGVAPAPPESLPAQDPGPSSMDPYATVMEGKSQRPPALRHGSAASFERRVTFSTMPPQSLDQFEGRYGTGEILGQGGMGEVRLTVDRRIGRSVAMKVIKPESSKRPKHRARFLFEAKVQGQLEHPSIVPVYDIGVKPDGCEYFTMKRVHGRTLHDVLKALRAGDKGTQLSFSRRRLLMAIQAVCQAVEFAHRRGVVHRDLKPANIMLGTLGEVSILDWGCAKLCETERAVTPSDEARAALTEARAAEETGVGEILGTPGYMSPEQTAGEASVDGTSDVFALGAILYETLTFFHLVPGQTSQQVNMNTLRGAYNAKISARFPDLEIAPELEEACVKATLPDRAERMQSAMELHETIERYLEGDRDVKRKRALAGKHTRAAIALVAEMSELTAPTHEQTKDLRSRAMREVMRALAIDPENPTALRTMMKIATEMPETSSPEVEAAIEQKEAEMRPRAARRGALAYCVATLTILFPALLGVRSWGAIIAPAALFAGAALAATLAWRRPKVADSFVIPSAMIVLSSSAIALSSLLFGVFLFVPSLCAANVIAFVGSADARFRKLAYACGLMSLVLPLALEAAGALPPSLSFTGDTITILPRAVHFSGPIVTVLLLCQAIGAMLLPAILVGAERDRRAKAERSLAARAHQLEALVPPEAKV